jgi:hypothetical protein
MPATENELHHLFTQLKAMADEIAGADMRPAEQAKVKALAAIGLAILESVVVDLNVTAYYLGEINHSLTKQ